MRVRGRRGLPIWLDILRPGVWSEQRQNPGGIFWNILIQELPKLDPYSLPAAGGGQAAGWLRTPKWF